MCELLAVRADEAFDLAALWGIAEGLERHGLAGYGWGVAWVRSDGTLGAHRATTAFRDDPLRDEIGHTETTAALVHLRRPSRFSWLGMADTQPFVDGAGRFAFAHNGELERHRDFRPRYRAAGRLQGRADSEVGQRWLEDSWMPGRPAAAALADLHATMGGLANLAILEPSGSLAVHAGNRENPVFTYRLGDLQVVSTGVYSLDRSVFRLVVPGARERMLVRPGRSATL
jgi:glutamine phosphoribosylpyrophosphate amidotransferase